MDWRVLSGVESSVDCSDNWTGVVSSLIYPILYISLKFIFQRLYLLGALLMP